MQAPELKRFQDASDTRFRVILGEGVAADLTLMEVDVHESPTGWESFSLVFDGPSPPAFWDGMFPVEHPELGSFVLFLVAVQTDSDGQQYEAVLNRRLS